MLDIKISSFSYTSKDGNLVLKDVSFSLAPGEHLAVLGESGCGKSTLLHLIYGLLSLQDGKISYKKKQLLGPTHNLIPGEPFMKMVSQELDIMPYISVTENIASHLDRNDVVKDNKRVEELLDIVQLQPFKDKKVKQLSGGQKQRVAIAKALAQKPEILLLDEPFSNIDTFLKNKLRRSLFNYTRTQNITCIIATHDSEEALSFTDKILILKNGHVVRIDTPKVIYNNLEDKYQGSFFGEVSIIDKGLLPYGENIPSSKSATNNYIVLPHQLCISKEKSLLLVVIVNSFYKGGFYLIEASHNNKTIYFNHTNALKKESKQYLTWNN